MNSSPNTPFKLPKQWKHWVRSAGLRPRANSGTTRGFKSAWFYLHGHGREWRVNCYNMLECGDTYEEFDRWARCYIRSATMPNTCSEFVATVHNLLAQHAVKVD